MSVSLRLDLRQSQSLVMTPQLQQAIKLLQLGNLELSAYVEQELEQNPFLEKREDGGDPAAAPLPQGAPATTAPRHAQRRAGLRHGHRRRAATDGLAPARTVGATPSGMRLLQGVAVEHVSDSFGYVGRGGSMAFEDEDDSLENRTSRPKTLKEHLIEQMLLDLRDGPERLIAHHLIDLVDDAGYLRGEIADVVGRFSAAMASLSKRSWKGCSALIRPGFAPVP